MLKKRYLYILYNTKTNLVFNKKLKKILKLQIIVELRIIKLFQMIKILFNLIEIITISLYNYEIFTK
jgi:hypothetical protein